MREYYLWDMPWPIGAALKEVNLDSWRQRRIIFFVSASAFI
jgi:hypothetical protein